MQGYRGIAVGLQGYRGIPVGLQGYRGIAVGLISPPEKTKFATTPLQCAYRNHNTVILRQDTKDLLVI